MKDVLKVSFVFALALVVLASCSKDQKCVNWLEGAEWKVTKLETIDTNCNVVDEIALITAQGLTYNGKMIFEKYSVKNDKSGAASFYTAVTGSVLGFPVNLLDTINYDYKIEDDCETLWLKEKGRCCPSDATIIEEASKTKMILSTYDATEKSTTRITIEK